MFRADWMKRTATYDGNRRISISKEKNLVDPEALHVVGMAAAQAARWNRKSEQFSFLVNDLYPAALKQDKNFWPAHLETALLFAEKYNAGDATNELNAALAINPNAAEIHAVRAALALQAFDFDGAKAALDRALAINPQSLVAHQVQADMLLADMRPIEAIAVLQAALQLNPMDDETLGRLAAVYGALDGIPADNGGTRMGKIIDEVVRRNAKCGEFFAAIASGFELLRRYPQAAKYYEEAQRRMPQLIHIPGELGMLQMRLGDEVEGSKLLTQAFEFDPFNVRVKNMLEVLDVLHDYAVLETDHFIIRFDRGQDELLAKFAAKYLEDEVYPEITQRLGYKPAEKSLFPKFSVSRPKNTKGHGWFSVSYGGTSVYWYCRRLCGKDGGDRLAKRHAKKVRLGASASSRIRPCGESTANGLQHSALVHRSVGCFERRLGAPTRMDKAVGPSSSCQRSF